ncbi:MAG: DUF4347 domain-containing protein, partial [Thermoplasmata archaeon]
MKRLKKICVIVVVGMLLGVNAYIMFQMEANELEPKHSVFVEDRYGDPNGDYQLERRADGRYDLFIWTYDGNAEVEIYGLQEPPQNFHVTIDSAEATELEYVIYFDSVEMERAVLTLPNSGPISHIATCEQFNPLLFEWNEWENSDIEFSEDEGSVTFEVELAGAYGTVRGPVVFKVTTTADSGEGSLRQAILDANARLGLDLIVFNIPSYDAGRFYYLDDGVEGQVALDNRKRAFSSSDSIVRKMDPDHPYSWWTISPQSALPIITDPVIIDGYTQEGAEENTLSYSNDAVLRIELDGSNAGMPLGGLHINSGGSTVRGLVVSGFGLCGIQADTYGGNVIEGNYIGTDVSGTCAINNFMGVNIYDVPNNVIGGITPASANLISGNHLLGILISGENARDNMVYGNHISMDSTGQKNLGNGASGIWIGEEIEYENTVRDNVISDDLKIQLMFIDNSVPDYLMLIEGLSSREYMSIGDYFSQIEVVILDAERDGIGQITGELAGRTDIAGIHIVSHGSPGTVHIAETILDSDSLHDYEEQLRSWDSALMDGADILLYGCEVARGSEGRQLVKDMSELTGADVAASIDPTGCGCMGGDWELEMKTGTIETELPFSSSAIEGYKHLLGTVYYYDYPLANYTANPKISSHTKHAIVHGLRELANMLGNVSSHSDLTSEFLTAIPGLLFVNETEAWAPGLASSLGGMSITDVFKTTVADEINDNFPANSILDNLVSFIDNLDTSTGNLNITVDAVWANITHINGTEYEININMTFEVTQNSTYKFDLGRNANLFGLSYDFLGLPDVVLESGLKIYTTFGVVVDLAEGNFDLENDTLDTSVEAVDNDFYVRDTSLAGMARVLAVDLEFGQDEGELQVGFLEIEVDGGTFGLYANMSASLVDPNNSDNKTRITLAELTGNSVDVLMSDDVLTDGIFSANLPVDVKLLGVSSWDSAFTSLSLDITFPPSDPFHITYLPDGSDDPRTAPPLNLSHDFSQNLLSFNNIMPDSYLGLLEQLKGWLGSFGVSHLFSAVDVPFADAHTLADVLDYFSGLDTLIDKISTTNEDDITIPDFVSAQTLATELDAALPMSLSQLSPRYVNATKELTFNINLQTGIGSIPGLPEIDEVPIDFDFDLGALGGIQTNILVSLWPY